MKAWWALNLLVVGGKSSGDRMFWTRMSSQELDQYYGDCDRCYISGGTPSDCEVLSDCSLGWQPPRDPTLRTGRRYVLGHSCFRHALLPKAMPFELGMYYRDGLRWHLHGPRSSLKMEELIKTLNGRVLLFVGDSTSQQFTEMWNIRHRGIKTSHASLQPFFADPLYLLQS